LARSLRVTQVRLQRSWLGPHWQAPATH
jgi:hypothetical protein